MAPIGAGREPSGDWNADWQGALHELNWHMAVFALPTTRSDVGSVSLTEGLVTGDLEEVSSIYAALSGGYRLCLELADEQPQPGHDVEELALPQVGDERFGWKLSLGDERDRWDIRWILVRDGAVLVAIEENEVLTGENLLSDEQVVEIVEKACAKLSSRVADSRA
ncbi:MAG: hypothetical protein OEQ47_04510 [Acidimicrobiia bacterium]|nr:hypothetical protein [Acidimicrobiia bacterium]